MTQKTPAIDCADQKGGIHEKEHNGPSDTPPEGESLRRLKNVRKQMEKRRLDALVIHSGPGSLRPDAGLFSLEDEFVVTKIGAERLNDSPQEIITCR